MARFTRAELQAFQGATVPDLLGPSPKLVFVGINPGLWTAATQTHFAHPGNRFYPALYDAGLTSTPFPAADGLDADQRQELIDRGLAITNVVSRATARADELTTADYRAGGAELVRRVHSWAPNAVVVLGVTAYRAAFARRDAQRGRQTDEVFGIPTFVFGNPSGLNAHETVSSLAEAFREAATVAGVGLVR